jgi:hypothetical protein
MPTVPLASGRTPRFLRHPALLGFCLAATAAGCGSKQKTPMANPADSLKTSMGAQFDRSRCDDQGKQVVTMDANGDGKADVIKLFVAVAQGGQSSQQLACKQTDLDFDGKIDLVQYYGPNGELLMDEYSMDYSGKFNGRTFFQEGKKLRSEKDMDFDGKPDYFEFFENGKLVRVERDRNGDGKIDEWQYYEGGRLDRIGWDTTGSGRVDKWERNPEGGPALPPVAQEGATNPATPGVATPATPAAAADAAAAAAAASAAAKGGPQIETNATPK